MIFRQLFDPVSATYTYLLADRSTHKGVLIDTVYERFARDAALVSELGIKLVATLETHVHADHVTAAWLFRERFGSRIGVGRDAATTGADRLLGHGDRVTFGESSLEVRATSGHTSGCLTYLLADRSMAFTGDALLIRGAGRTDFQQGDPARLYRSVREQILSLPDETLLYPAHDYAGRMCTTVREERLYNPRLGGERSVEDFVGFMQNLHLPHPNQIDIAVPANLRCGEPSAQARSSMTSAWAPVVRTYAGVPELPIEWVVEHQDEVRLIDVREPREWSGELGHIEGAELVPLGTLQAASSSWPKDPPIVTVCRSGGRSAQAALLLEAGGFAQVANLAGGMVHWRNARLPTRT